MSKARMQADLDELREIRILADRGCKYGDNYNIGRALLRLIDILEKRIVEDIAVAVEDDQLDCEEKVHSLVKRVFDARDKIADPELVVIPVEQLVDIYQRFCKATRLGQASIDDWVKMPEAEQKLRHDKKVIHASMDRNAAVVEVFQVARAARNEQWDEREMSGGIGDDYSRGAAYWIYCG